MSLGISENLNVYAPINFNRVDLRRRRRRNNNIRIPQQIRSVSVNNDETLNLINQLPLQITNNQFASQLFLGSSFSPY